MEHTQPQTDETGSYAAFATGLIGYLLLNLAVALSIWETAQATTGQQALTWTALLAPPTIVGALFALPASRRAGGEVLRGLALGCLGGAALVLVLAALGRLAG